MTKKLYIDPFLMNAFELMVEGVLCINEEEEIIFANKVYLKFIKLKKEEVIGKKLRDLRPHAELPNVMRSGKPMLHKKRQEGTQEPYFVNMYPVYMDDRIVGGISIVTFLDQAYRNKMQIEDYERENMSLINQYNQSGQKYNFDSIVAADPASLRTKAYAKKLAKGDFTVLITGESGTGKELYAQAIHHASHRRNGVFLAVNCAGFSKEMLESELFGYVEGAFTGAKKGGKQGLFAAARGGTLFLDEIANMDMAVQAKVLRALQEMKIRPVGGTKEYDVDVRVICACNENLEEMVTRETFRKDLYYRISPFPVEIMPLRERKKDIPELVYAFLAAYEQKEHRSIMIADAAMECLLNYDWPGNVRELKNVIDFSVYLSENNVLEVKNLPQQIADNSYSGVQTEDRGNLANRVKAFEKREILRMIEYYGDTIEGKKQAAKALGISLSTLYVKIK